MFDLPLLDAEFEPSYLGNNLLDQEESETLVVVVEMHFDELFSQMT
jgi:hypothetical protein